MSWAPGIGWCPAQSTTPLVVDSWLVVDGRTVDRSAHETRFVASAQQLLDAGGAAAEFFTAAVRRLPTEGRWWPRISIDTTAQPRAAGSDAATGPQTPTFTLALRPAPEQGPAALYGATACERSHPLVKGPDLPWLEGLRAAAQQAGASDHVLLDGEGCVLESDHSALAWWDGDILVIPDGRRLGSVTLAWAQRMSQAHGIRVERRRTRCADLDGAEVWLLNAARGIRGVTQWVESPGGIQPATPTRAARWHERWEEAACAS